MNRTTNLLVPGGLEEMLNRHALSVRMCERRRTEDGDIQQPYHPRMVRLQLYQANSPLPRELDAFQVNRDGRLLNPTSRIATNVRDAGFHLAQGVSELDVEARVARR